MLLVLSVPFAFAVAAQEKPRSLYDGGSVRFDQAQLIKPRENTNLSLAFTLAPLIVQEVRGTNTSPAPTRVYFRNGSIRLHGRDHQQMTYWWTYADGRSAQMERGPDAGPIELAGPEAGASVQGVRITLNTNGSPVIYEVLGQRGSVAQIYVSQSLEATAQREFGPVLPGRRHAIERSLDDAPAIVVPRILDEAGTVMGPILYLNAQTHDVATLICRCMDSQAKTLVGQSFYKLVPTAPSRNTSDATRLDAATPRGLREDFLTQTNRLSQSLRLPATF